MTIPQPEDNWTGPTKTKFQTQKFIDSVKTNKFLQNLKQTAEENPVVVLVAVAAIMTAGAKLIKAYGESKGSRAYAKQVEYRIRKGR